MSNTGAQLAVLMLNQCCADRTHLDQRQQHLKDYNHYWQRAPPFIMLKTMSMFLGAILLLTLLVGVLATVIAIVDPRLRALSTIVACMGFLGAAVCVGVFILVVSGMAND
jgi:hypothetical protein